MGGTDFTPGTHGFLGMIDVLGGFSKPLICAVNGLGIDIAATILGYADLALMSSTARLMCPFTSLGVGPEAASSYLLPRLVDRQNAAWLLMSAEWISADDALRMGLVWRVCEPDQLVPEALRHADILASWPISSLMAVMQAMVAPMREGIDAARRRENDLLIQLMGAEANVEALDRFSTAHDNPQS